MISAKIDRYKIVLQGNKIPIDSKEINIPAIHGCDSGSFVSTIERK